MRYIVCFLFVLSPRILSAQGLDKSLFIGTWKIQGVILQKEIVSFASADTLTKKLISKRKTEQPGKLIPRGDSLAISMGASFLCGVLNELVIQINIKNEMYFMFTKADNGRKELKTETLKFEFKGENVLETTDEKGNINDLKIERLTPTTLVLSGISSARYMQLSFRRQ